MNAAGDRVPLDAQSVDAPLSKAAVFLTLSVGEGVDDLEAARDALVGVEDLIKTVGFRDLSGRLSCVVGIGATAWKRLSPSKAPAQLHPFRAVRGDPHTAPSTPGDLLFHIRAERADLCFEFERILLASLGDHVRVVDEVSAFRYFDERDLLGFVDGTANPVAQDIAEAALVGDSDPDWAGGSYVVTQKYLHDLDAWAALTTEQQEAVIGRSKIDNIERDSDTEARPSHKTLTTITDDDGVEHDILRDNMPFGRPGQGEFGTFFIGYARDLWVTERMLERMFIGDPVGTYDLILDFSTAVTGNVFFAPSRDQLAALEDAGAEPAVDEGELEEPAGSPLPTDGSLGIGSLRATKGSAS